MPLILPRRSLLTYPAGTAPGFDPNHIAASGISAGKGISVVPVNGNFVDLTTGRIGTVAGTPTSVIQSYLGRSIRSAAGSDGFDFTGKLAFTPPAITLAAIVQFDSVVAGNYQCIIEADTGSPNGLLALNGAGVFVMYESGDNSSSISPAINTPYFLAASTKGTAYNFVVVNLRTGVTRTATVAGNAIGASNGTYRIANNTTQPLKGTLAAAMYAPTYLTVPQLLQWSSDPWAFWYPNKMLNLTTDSGVTPPSIQYAAFSTPQHDGQSLTQMTGY